MQFFIHDQGPYPAPMKLIQMMRSFRDEGFPGLEFTGEGGSKL